MAKTLVTYKLYPFDNVKAAAGSLCVMVPSSYDGKITIGNVEVDGIKNIDLKEDGTYDKDNKDFLGAGICRYKAPNNYFLSVNSITYTFNERGMAISLNAKGKEVRMAEQVNLTLTASGSVVGNAYPTTRGGTSGEDTASTNYNQSSTVLVDTLNARDEFAAQALRGMLAHINDPSTLSDNEIAFYCEEAYRWAASMMLSAANRRANGYENTTDTALGQIATAVSQGSQNTIGMNTAQNSNLTVSPASVTGTGTFTLGVANGYVIPASSDAQHWQNAWTFANSSGISNGTITLGNNSITPLTASNMWSALNSPDSTKKIDASHLPAGFLTWSDLSTYDNTPSHKVAGKYIDGTWWGQTMQAGNIVNGDLQDVGNIYLKGGTAQFSMRYIENGSTDSKAVIIIHPLTNISPVLSIGYGTRYERKTQLHGKEIEFIVQNASATSASQPDGTGITAMTILGRESSTNAGKVVVGNNSLTGSLGALNVNGTLRIGNILFTSEGSNLKISRYDGTAANVYSTGGVTALGLPSSNSGTVDNVSTKQLNIVGDSNTAKLFVVGSELRATINGVTYRLTMTPIS